MAAGDTRLYDADQVLIFVAGIPVSGFADGEFARIERESPAFEDVVGTDGEVTRSKTNDNRATVTIRLMQTSPSNALLSAAHNLDKNAPGGVGVGPFLLVDKRSLTTYTAEKCWIMQDPDASFDRTATEREWQVRCASLNAVHGAGA